MKYKLTDGTSIIVSIITFIIGCLLLGIALDTGIKTPAVVGLGLMAVGGLFIIITAIHYYDKN